ncbi:MAG TPA: 50S ribosomal protein L11 methyltransferase, partial [Fimbriimonas sp.]
MSWIEVQARFDPSIADLSPFVEIYREHGIENTLESRHSLTGCLVDVDGSQEAVARLSAALRSAGATEVSAQPLPEEDWDQLWRKHFKPRRVGSRFVICPSWEKYEARPDDLVILLDPGQAFGTGEHATTRMCLELLEKAHLTGKTVLDLGCGSGILSVAAVKLGALRVVAVDIDPVSVQVARENAERNGVWYEASTGDGLDELDGAFDVLVSNIISATLIRLAPDAIRYVQPKGTWILSGVITQNWPDVRR